MIVCSCKVKSDRQIAFAVQEGVETFAALCDHVDISNDCGQCARLTKRIFEECLEALGKKTKKRKKEKRRMQ